MSLYEQVYVIRHDLQRDDPPAVFAGFRADQFLTPGRYRAAEDRPTVLRAPCNVIPKIVDATCGYLHLPDHAGDYTHGLCQTTRFPRRLKTAAPSRGA
jgi:hypothetical protein